MNASQQVMAGCEVPKLQNYPHNLPLLVLLIFRTNIDFSQPELLFHESFHLKTLSLVDWRFRN